LFQTTDVVSTFSPVLIPEFYNSITMWSEKLKGFVGFRCDFEFVLQVNATRFQQGRYMLCWTPSGGVANSVKTTFVTAMHNFSLQQRTQLPHGELDLNTDSEVHLNVPYTSCYPYYPVRAATTASGSFNFGTVQIFPYQAINSGTASYTLWARMINVELMAPTVPQARTGTKTIKKSQQEVEQDSQGIGPIQGIARKVSDTSEILGQIPLLSSFTEPVKWVSDIVGNVASIFGWSKPVDLAALTRVFPARAYYTTHYDASDISAMISASTRNQIEVCPGFASSDLDEMSIDYLKSIPAFFKKVNWSTSDAKQTLLYSLDICPDSFGLAYTDNALTVFTSEGKTPWWVLKADENLLVFSYLKSAAIFLIKDGF
jgi:hypothetical protein